MNIYVVRQATQGLANYVLMKYGKGSVAISHDSRIKADLFMNEAAKVLAANGIKTYITTELQPTPVLSYLVRYFKCQAGIMVTASHNPAKYNGYKAYGEDGCQMTDAAAQAVYDEICKLALSEYDEEALTEEELQMLKDYDKAMLDDRNLGMAEKAKEYLASGETVFFAVGTAHMLAEPGIVNLLREAGYTVERYEY